MSVSLEAPAVVVLDDLGDVIARLPDDQKGTAEAVAATARLPSVFDVSASPVRSAKQGYLHAIDYEGLTELAEGSDLILRLAYRPGQHVIEGTPLLHAWPADRCGGEKVAERVNAAFICGRNATTEQDLEQGLRQMVEVAVRSLSPGVNDPFTAINCIDALGSAICGVARRGLLGPHRYDGQGKLRIVTPVMTFASVVDTAFSQIRQYGRASVAVTIPLLEVVAICGRQMVNDDQRECLLRHAKIVYEDSQEPVSQPRDRDDVRVRWEIAVRALDVRPDCAQVERQRFL